MRFLVAAALFAFTCLASAGTVRFDLAFTIDRIEAPYGCGGQTFSFGCFDEGDVLHGQITVPDESLGTDGVVVTLPSFTFDLDFGAQRYSTGPSNNALAGFRNLSGQYFDFPLAGPSVRVSNGSIVELLGDVHAISDMPFVTFYGTEFVAFDGSMIYGTIGIARAMPEPSSVWLALLGAVAALASLEQRRRGVVVAHVRH